MPARQHTARSASVPPTAHRTVKHVYTFMTSPVGELKLVASDRGLVAILWQNDDPDRVRLNLATEEPSHRVLVEAERQLRAYFAGTLKSFSLPIDFAGTDFQKAVWTELLGIPFGETRTYAQIARQIGKPDAVRAVGAAIGRNPISIAIPCHRVIGSNGALTGFAGGLPAKQYLLDAEGGQRALVPAR
jgi:methylated-DNA-[protein]-cysteine S-methyltransferase